MNSKQWVIVSVVVVVILGAVGFLATKMMPSFGVNYQQSATTPTTAKISTKNETVSVGPGTSMPANWPKDVPGNYDGAKLVYSGSAGPQGADSGVVVSYTVKDASVKTIAAYYEKGLTASGWVMQGNINTGKQVIIGAKKDIRTFGVSVTDGGNGVVGVTAGFQAK